MTSTLSIPSQQSKTKRAESPLVSDFETSASSSDADEESSRENKSANNKANLSKKSGDEGKEGKKKKKKKKDGKKKRKSDKKLRQAGLVMNDRGEIVTANEYSLEKTLEATNKSLESYRERMENLISTNQELQQSSSQQEKDALDVIAALQKESEQNESRINHLLEQIELLKEESKQEQELIKKQFEEKISAITAVLNEKEAATKVMQQEFSVIKDFKKKRNDLLKDLETQKLELIDTEKRHKEIITKMERKFFEEKIRLQKDANRKISELATAAHKEAVTNLKKTTKEVYKENLRIAEALRYHVQEGEELKKLNQKLLVENRRLKEESELHDVIVKEKILQNKQQSSEILDLRSKVRGMEHSLSHVVREFEQEREIMGRLAREELNDIRKETSKFKDLLDRRTAEMRHIRRLAQHVLDQRTDVEKFFLDALETVRAELAKEKHKQQKIVQAEYNRKMRAVMATKGLSFPIIQSFRPAQPEGQEPTEASNQNNDVPENEPPTVPQPSQIDISDLQWIDKERILRLLFAKMNGVALGPRKTITQPYEKTESGSDKIYQNPGNFHPVQVNPKKRNTVIPGFAAPIPNKTNLQNHFKSSKFQDSSIASEVSADGQLGLRGFAIEKESRPEIAETVSIGLFSPIIQPEITIT
ncbi:hypothetical protein HK098_003545 [Nowakowskiella sp. JEL0407]|nr:hypothetical protein HK098_003545 [Nowakowskiella sp. JEL0407]